MKPPRLSEIMTRNPVTVRSDDPLRVATEVMRQHQCRRLPVVDGDKLVGIVSDRDVRLALNSPFIMRERREDQALLDSVLIAACMTPNPVTLAPDASVLDAVRVMHDRKFGGIPVVEGSRLVGIVTETDVLQCFINLLSE
ncbi:MAG TPA: CBS domain-containing protein [Anaerolineae bacterium]